MSAGKGRERMKGKNVPVRRGGSPGLRPGDGYRFLKKGEGIEPTDDVWNRGEGPWQPAGVLLPHIPAKLQTCFQVVYNPETMSPFRRRIETRSVGGAQRSRPETRNPRVTQTGAKPQRKEP